MEDDDIEYDTVWQEEEEVSSDINPELKRLYQQHPECNLDYIDQIIPKIPLQIIPGGEKSDSNHRTYPFLTNFERTKIIDKVPDKDIDKNFNYYYNKHIYIYDTKNKRDYIMLLPDEIIPYIDITKPFLFGNNIKQLSIIIPKVFNKLYGHPYTAREIRKLYATYSNNTQFSMRERFANAAAMGHSMEENLRYSYK